MSFTDRVVLWLHIAAAVFTIGPATAAIMATPRYIRKRNAVVLGYLRRVTGIYAAGTLLVLVFGLIVTQQLHDFSKPWISASITLYVVSAVLLILIVRDQRKAVNALTAAQAAADATDRSDEAEEAGPDQEAAHGERPQPGAAAGELRVAAVERGRIAMMAGITALIWLAILVLMVWGSQS